MTKRLWPVLGCFFFAIQFIYAGANVYEQVTAPSARSIPGWDAIDKDGRIVILGSVDPGSPLRTGDRIVLVGGRTFDNREQLVSALEQLEPGTPYSIVVDRASRMYVFTLRTDSVPLVRITMTLIALAVILGIFLITGFAVFILKPYDKQALLLSLMFGMIIAYIPLHSAHAPPSWLALVIGVSRILSLFAWPIFFHFFLIFPEPSTLLKRFPRIELYLYIPYSLTFAPADAYEILRGFAPRSLPPPGPLLSRLGDLGGRLIVLYIAAGLLLLLYNYKQANWASRRRMRVVVAGSIAGFMPILLVASAFELFGIPRDPVLIRWIGALLLCSFPLFPLSFAYAIVRHQVIPVRLMIRRGVRYVFVSQGSIVLELVAVFASLAFLLYSFFTYLDTRSGLEIGIISGVVSVVVWEATGILHRKVIAPAIDRRFFRQAYNAQQIISDLGSALRSMTDIEEMTDLAGGKILDALNTENVAFFLLDEPSGNYRCVARCEWQGKVTHDGESLSVSSGGPVIDRLARAQVPLTVDFEDSTSWAYRIALSAMRGNTVSQSDCDVLRSVKSALLIPISMKDRPLGIISLGSRLGDLPFSRDDKQLLSAVASQMAFAIENSHLVRRMVEQQRLKQELIMAAEVQRRLFPECPPQMRSVELCGVCHPARGIGGDYYDFVVLGEGKVGVAVADVAGKGISAALLMSIVQASLRSQALSVNGRITDLVQTMNRQLHRSTGASGYASLFYGQFDEGTGLLTYVNAGHNPPLLIRAVRMSEAEPLAAAFSAGSDGGSKTGSAIHVDTPGLYRGGDESMTRLETGGIVIGLFESSSYQQASVQMFEGDMLIAYTDGLTEAVNHEGEEFGEARLRKLVEGGFHLSPDYLSNQIVQCVRDWSGSVPQHDDLTLVIMKVRSDSADPVSFNA